MQYHIIEENVDKEISYDEATQIALRCFDDEMYFFIILGAGLGVDHIS